MHKHVLWLGIAVVLALAPAAAQNRAKLAPASGPVGRVTVEQPLAGKWTYRSFINTADLVGSDPNKALDLIFGEGVFTFETPSSASLTGTFDMGGGFVLDLVGTFHPAAQGAPLTVEIVGSGRANTQTAGWEYDYHAYLAYPWQNGVNQVPALVGSVIRAKPHDSAPAGFVASFIAVKQP